MKTKPVRNVSHSVRQRLLNLARSLGRPYADLEQYFALERFLYRLAGSNHAEQFVLKGAMMLRVWSGSATRATRDIDVLSTTRPSVAGIVAVLRRVVEVSVLDDGVRFDSGSVRAQVLRQGTHCEGVRAHVRGFLGTSRLHVQVDVGFGDVVFPAPTWIDFPEILDYGRPRVMVYPPESSIAEKFQAMVRLDAANTRMKDFHDVALLARSMSFRGEILSGSIRATFRRRETAVPGDVPGRAVWDAGLCPGWMLSRRPGSPSLAAPP